MYTHQIWFLDLDPDLDPAENLELANPSLKPTMNTLGAYVPWLYKLTYMISPQRWDYPW
jgi:hypothetical protein